MLIDGYNTPQNIKPQGPYSLRRFWQKGRLQVGTSAWKERRLLSDPNLCRPAGQGCDAATLRLSLRTLTK